MWSKQFDVFAWRYKLICYDSRGYGRSRPPDMHHKHTQALYSLLQARGIRQMACSSAACLAMILAACSPSPGSLPAVSPTAVTQPLVSAATNAPSAAQAPAIPRASPTPLPPTSAPTAAVATALPPATAPIEGGTPTVIALSALPKPSATTNNDPRPPAAWLIVGDRAVLGSIGGFEYTIDLGGGNRNLATRDAGPPDASSTVAHATLPAAARAVLAIDTAEIRQIRVIVEPWPPDPHGNSPNQHELAATGHREGDAMIYALAPTGSDGDQLLRVFVSFTGEIHQNDYADYYWRLNP